MDRTCGNKGVDTETFRNAKGFAGSFNILGHATRQTAGNRLFQCGGNLGNAFKVTLGRDRETGFQNIDAEFFERQRDLQLLTRRKALRQRLFTIAKRGVKNNDPIVARHLQNSLC